MKQCQLLTQAQLLLKMLDKCLLLLVFHTAGKKFLEWKSPWVDSIYQKRSSVGAVWAHTSSEPFPEAGWTWGRCIYGGPGCAALAQRSSANGGAELGWPLLKTRAAYKWPGIVFTEDLPLQAHLLLKDISFGALEATWPLSKRSPCSCVGSCCCGTLGSSMPGLLFSPAGLALRTVPHL